MRFGWNPQETSIRIRWLAKAAALLFIVIYTAIYFVQPFSETWNEILANSFTVLAAASAASIATMIWASYDRSDTPRRVWSCFAIGLWLWVIAELVWAYLNVTRGEVLVGLPDVFWITAYLFFGLALFRQVQIVMHLTKRELWSRGLITMILGLITYLLIYSALSRFPETRQLDAIVNAFYPAADLLLGLSALWLVRRFIGGAFARPWLGLLAFAFADFMYAWLENSGMYAWSMNQGNLLSSMSDILYIAAYLVLGLGLFSQWAFLKYGLRSPTEPH